jgi:N-hydroxyarylamine O-acetyltransferase
VAIGNELTDSVLAKLGFSSRPSADRDGLDALYLAWCRRVPFDNLGKRIHLVSGSTDPFPNADPVVFLESWLRDGAGGTCWPSTGGLHALLAALGFDARLGSAAMYDNLSGPIHTHGTVIVRLDGADWWVDTSMLTDQVLPLVPGGEAHLDDPVRRARVEPVDDLWRVWWTHPFVDEMIGCLLLDDDVTAEHYRTRYEASRDLSPFNTAVYATRSDADTRVTVAFDTRWERRAEGVTSTELGPDRERVLVEEFGYSEAIVARLPADDPPPAQK